MLAARRVDRTHREQETRIRLVGVLIRHSGVAEDLHLRTCQPEHKTPSASTKEVAKCWKEDSYLDSGLEPKLRLVLDQHPRQRRADLCRKQSFPFGLIHREADSRPDGQIQATRGTAILERPHHQSPSTHIFDIEEEEVLQALRIGFGASGELRVLEKEDIGVLVQWDDFPADTVGLDLVLRRVDVIRDHEPGFHVDHLSIDTAGCLEKSVKEELIEKCAGMDTHSVSLAPKAHHGTLQQLDVMLSLSFMSMPSAFIMSRIPMYGHLALSFFSTQP